jgi:hypothetical protein
MEHQSTEICDLPASGFTRTTNDVYDWAKAVVTKVKEKLPEGQINAAVWAYREQGYEWLAVCFHRDDDDTYDLGFTIGEDHSFHLVEPGVPDMTEALHMVGILCEALAAKIQIGRRCNEVNPYCTQEEWRPGQTNGQLVLR